MLGTFEAVNTVDVDGNPAGGTVRGTGLTIDWQNGPLGRGEDRTEPNGAFVETVIAATIDRITFYQTTKDGQFACDENSKAIEDLQNALYNLNQRTTRRETAGTEGTHVGS